MSERWALASRRVMVEDAEGRRAIRDAAVLIDGEHIIAVTARNDVPTDVAVHDAGERVIMPGVIDAHVHLNDPGRVDWEGFESGTRAAAAGGITLVADMPLNSSPVTTSLLGLEAKRQSAKGRLWVDVGLHGGVQPGMHEHIEALVDAGVLAMKAFMVPSGLDEFRAVGERDLEPAMRTLARLGVPLLVHAEVAPAEAAASRIDPRSYADYVASRPSAWEVDAIAMLIDLCRRTGCAVHIVHLATADALDLLRATRATGLPISVETCPHYLSFHAEAIADGDTRFKCAPPIRGARHRDALWRALMGTGGEPIIDLVASDHSPAPPALKLLNANNPQAGDFQRAWGGIASLQLLLPALWTGARERGASLDDVSGWLSRAPAGLLGVDDRKGRLTPGYHADMVVWDPEASFVVVGEELEHRHAATPYEGLTLHGVVEQTLVRGHVVFDRRRGSDRDSRTRFSEPIGRLINRAARNP